jgi:hypothetical protein
MEQNKAMIIGGGGNNALTLKRIAELRTENPDIEIVSLNEAKEKGLSQTYEYKAPPQLPELVSLKDNFKGVKSARNKRREEERKAKKNKKN